MALHQSEQAPIKNELHEVRDQVEKAEFLLPESVRHLNKLIDKASPADAAVLLENLDRILNELKRIQDLKDILSPKSYKEALERFFERIQDFALSQKEVRDLFTFRQTQLNQHIALRDKNLVRPVPQAAPLDQQSFEASLRSTTRVIPSTAQVAQEPITFDGADGPVTVTPEAAGLSTDFAESEWEGPEEEPEETPSTHFTDDEKAMVEDEIAREKAAAAASEDTETPEAVALPAQSELTLVSFPGTSVEIPELFRGENSFEHIETIKDLESGEAIYNALRMMAAIHRDQVGLIDTRMTWKALHGGILSKGGRFEINSNEIAKAVYGKNEDQLEANTPHLEKFFAAVQTLINELPSAQEDAEKIRIEKEAKTQREAAYEGLTGEKAAMFRLTGEVFDRNSQGPSISYNVFQAIAFTLSGKDRPTVNADNWMSTARQRVSKGYKSYGEQQVISHARAFDKLMNHENGASYLETLNTYLIHGQNKINGEKNHLGYGKAVSVAPITLENLNDPTFTLSKDQIAAIRYGAMAFAAAEMRVLQNIEAEEITADVNTATNGMVDELTAQIPAGTLTDEQEKALKEDLGGHIQGVLSGLAAIQPGEEVHAMAALEAGALIPLLNKDFPGRLSLQWTVSAGTVLPVLRMHGGLIYQIDLGKKGRTHLEAYARLSAGLSDPQGLIGPTFGLGISRDLNESGTLSLGTGANLGLSKSGDVAGFHPLSLDRNLDKVLQKRIREFKETHKEELETIRTEIYAQIDDLEHVEDPMKKALKAEWESYVNYRIAYGETKDFSKWSKQIKYISAGPTAAVGLKEGGFALGAYITFGVGFRPVTRYIPALLETPDMVSDSMKSGLPVALPVDYKEVQPDWEPIELKDEFLYENDGDKANAEAEAIANASKALAAMNEKLKGQAVLTFNGKFTQLTLQNIDGMVRFYPDAMSDIEAIQDGDGGAPLLNLDSGDALLLRTLETTDPYTGKKLFFVGLTSDENTTIEQIMSQSPSYMEWIQTKDGTTDTRLLKNDKVENPLLRENILTRTDVEAKDNGLVLGDLSLEGAKQNAREVEWETVRMQEGVREVKLFEGLTHDDHEDAKAVAEQLVKTDKMDYDHLAVAANRDTIDSLITERYKNIGVTEPTDQQILLAHQYAMQIGRPDAKEIPWKWNTEAAQAIFGEEDGARVIESLQANANTVSSLPEGSEFLIAIDDSGTRKLLQGYYDFNIHGGMNGAMYAEKDDPAAQSIKGLSEWKKLPANASFKDIRKDMAGLRLAQIADKLYGPEDGRDIKQMVETGVPTHPELAQEFTQDVLKLLKDGQSMVRGNPVTLTEEFFVCLYGKCENLTVARNVEIDYTLTQPKEVKVAATRQALTQEVRPEIGVDYTTLRVSPGVIPIVPGGGFIPPLPGQDKPNLWGSPDELPQNNPGDHTITPQGGQNSPR
ncbi:MAG: hypothetical protein WC777_04800 [Candidatus Gracilibacteria bacterium]